MLDSIRAVRLTQRPPGPFWGRNVETVKISGEAELSDKPKAFPSGNCSRPRIPTP
jgi:hypothetical protein